jgi:hypothetical protein
METSLRALNLYFQTRRLDYLFQLNQMRHVLDKIVSLPGRLLNNKVTGALLNKL